MAKAYDIIIVGAGVTGLLHAACLSKDFNIAIIDAKNITQPQQEQLRVSSLTPTSQRVLQRLQVWSQLPPHRIGSFKTIYVWDANSSGEIEFQCHDFQQAQLGFIVENALLQHALFQTLQQRTTIDWYLEQPCHELRTRPDEVQLELASGERLTAQLLVGADGANSWVRQQAGVATTAWDYGQHAVVTSVECEYSHGYTAQQRFLATGPLAFLPLHDEQRCSIVWSTTPSEAERLCGLPEVEFLSELTAAFDAKLGRVTACAQRHSLPLRMQHAKQYVQTRLALIGDSAHSFHPLAGQGLNLALLDACRLAEVIVEARQNQQDFGALKILLRYQYNRRRHALQMLTFLETMKRLFAPTAQPVVWFRQFGLKIANNAFPLKRWFAEQALGMRADLPNIAKQ